MDGSPKTGRADALVPDGRPRFSEWLVLMAEAASLRSRDPSTKVGAVIVRPDKSVAAVGYNGFPRGMEDRSAWYADRAEKYDRVIHAEMNALLSMKENAAGTTVAVTHPPLQGLRETSGSGGRRKGHLASLR